MQIKYRYNNLEETEEVEIPFLYRINNDKSEEIILTDFPDTIESTDEYNVEPNFVKIDKTAVLQFLDAIKY